MHICGSVRLTSDYPKEENEKGGVGKEEPSHKASRLGHKVKTGTYASRLSSLSPVYY